MFGASMPPQADAGGGEQVAIHAIVQRAVVDHGDDEAWNVLKARRMASATQRRRWTAMAAILTLALSQRSAAAHEIGTTQVSALFDRDGSFRVDILVDPDTLLMKLEAVADAPLPRPSHPTSRDERITSLEQVLLDHVTLAFDGARVTPSCEYLPAAPGRPAVVRLRGRIPQTARSFTWAYDLVLGSYALNIQTGAGPPHSQWIEGRQTSAPEPLSSAAVSTARSVARQYLVLGFTHIVPRGLDHILFVISIFLLNARWRAILAQVSAFTAAHSITLGLSMYGLVSLPPRIVEPMIALSIAYVAVENLVTSELKPWRIGLVFGFGLLHGLGFAGVLADLGLPHADFLTALVASNLGVECGQLTVIALAFATVANWRTDRLVYRRFIVQPASLLIAAIGIYWTVQRAMSLS